jgi:hypothetical protein
MDVWLILLLSAESEIARDFCDGRQISALLLVNPTDSLLLPVWAFWAGIRICVRLRVAVGAEVLVYWGILVVDEAATLVARDDGNAAPLDLFLVVPVQRHLAVLAKVESVLLDAHVGCSRVSVS